jgi:cytochrome b561
MTTPTTAPGTPADIARYSAVTQTFHWISAILVLAAFAMGPGGPEDLVYIPERATERAIHETLGMAVFAISVLRILWKLFDRAPTPVPLARWMHIASKSAQGMLYLLLLAVPLTALFGAWLEGHPVVLLGGLTLVGPIAASHDLGSTIAEIHGWLGDVIIWIAGVHAAAAIYHHWFLKDGVLQSMLPGWWPLKK